MKGAADRMLENGARVMWIAAHPDDESMAGALLAKAGPGLGNPLYFLVLTRGEGGQCCVPEGCGDDLADFRAKEMARAAELYGAELQVESFYNAPLPTDAFPTRHEIAARWREKGDPARICADAIRRFRPDLVLTFEPTRGFTGHPEHQLASRFAMAGIRMAADLDVDLGGGEPHRVEATYFGLNRFWFFRLVGPLDPGPETERFDATQPCRDGKTCGRLAAEFTTVHRSQNADMRQVRVLTRFIRNQYLRRVDPFTEILDPYEIARA